MLTQKSYSRDSSRSSITVPTSHGHISSVSNDLVSDELETDPELELEECVLCFARELCIRPSLILSFENCTTQRCDTYSRWHDTSYVIEATQANARSGSKAGGVAGVACPGLYTLTGLVPHGT